MSNGGRPSAGGSGPRTSNTTSASGVVTVWVVGAVVLVVMRLPPGASESFTGTDRRSDADSSVGSGGSLLAHRALDLSGVPDRDEQLPVPHLDRRRAGQIGDEERVEDLTPQVQSDLGEQVVGEPGVQFRVG